MAQIFADHLREATETGQTTRLWQRAGDVWQSIEVGGRQRSHLRGIRAVVFLLVTLGALIGGTLLFFKFPLTLGVGVTVLSDGSAPLEKPGESAAAAAAAEIVA